MSATTRRGRKRSGISFGVFLICLGVLLVTKWWWPGIILALGLPAGAEMIFRGKTVAGIGVIVVFTALTLGVAALGAIDISGTAVGAMVLIVLGGIVLVKVFFGGGEPAAEDVPGAE
jgi:hypothetical protein